MPSLCSVRWVPPVHLPIHWPRSRTTGGPRGVPCPEGEARRIRKHHTRRGPVPRRWGSALIVLHGGGSKATPPCACGQDLHDAGGRRSRAPRTEAQRSKLSAGDSRLRTSCFCKSGDFQQLSTTQYDSARHRATPHPFGPDCSDGHSGSSIHRLQRGKTMR
jgi:hypothetical protein